MKAALKTIISGAEELKSGVSIFIFPEGTRNSDPDRIILPFKDGSFKMAQKAKCPVIPVAITNTREIFENHLPFVKACDVIIEYCPAVDISSLEGDDKKHIGAYFQNIIAEKLTTNKTLIA